MEFYASKGFHDEFKGKGILFGEINVELQLRAILLNSILLEQRIHPL